MFFADGRFVIIMQSSGLGMGVGRFTRLLRRVGVLAMLDVGLDTTRPAESVCKGALGAGVLQLVEPCMVVVVFVDRSCVGHRVGVTRGVISATRELFSEDEGVEI
jgi:hypothetical protein